MSATLSLDGDFLRPYQKAAIVRFLEGAQEGHRRQIIQKPTGTGKTITGLALAKKVGRTLWLAHREELIDQPIETLSDLWPEARHGIVKQQRDQKKAKDIVFASVQSAVGRLDGGWGGFDLCVVDEAHHAASASYRKTIDHFAAANPSMLVAGLTATPIRGDKKNLSLAGFTAFAYRMSITEAIRHGFLVPFVAERVILPKFDGSKVRIAASGDFDEKSLAEELERAHAAEATALAVVEKCAGRKTIVFAASVALAKKTYEELRRLGITAGWVCGETPTEERKKTLRDLKSGKIQVISNAMVLTEGFDCPTLSAAVIARPTRSKGLYIQMVGRILRVHPTKDHALILDTVGAHKAHGLQLASRLTSPTTERDRELETGGLKVFEEFGTPDEEPPEPESKAGVIVSRFLDEATTGESYKVMSGRANWIEAAPGLFALPLGEESRSIVLFQRNGKWVAEVGSMKIMEANDLSLVQGAAEDYARGVDAIGLSWKAAVWRSREPTGEQIGIMKRLCTFYADGTLTQGEAADLISLALVRKKYNRMVKEALL